VSDIVPTFGRREEGQRGRNKRGDLIKAPRSDRTEERFQFRERLFDRIEIRAVGRQKPEARSRAFDRRADFGLLVDDEVIQDHDIPPPQRRDQHLLYVGAEARLVDRPIEYGGRGDFGRPQGGDDGLRFPVTARRVVVEARAARTSAVAAQEVRGDAALVEEHILTGVVQRLRVSPLPTLGGDISASLFVGVYGFF
jgi:hypothetical protein